MIQKRWYRKLTGSTYFLSDGSWRPLKNFKVGQRIEKVEGRNVDCLAWCHCGNELIHSKSYVGHYIPNNHLVYHYICTYCQKEQWWNASLIPGLIECDKTGEPL